MTPTVLGLYEHAQRVQRRRWHMGLATATGLHLLVAVGLLAPSWLTTAQPMPIGSAPLVVELQPFDAAPPAPPTYVPQAREQRPAQEAVKPVVRTPTPPRVKLPPTPREDDLKAAEPEPPIPTPQPTREPQVAQTETAVASHQAAQQQETPVAPMAGATNATSVNPTRSWEAQVVGLLERGKRYPSAARWQRQQDKVFVDIVLDRSGQVLSAQIGASAGFAALDDEVLDLVRRVAPFPKPPSEVEGERIALRVPVEFTIERH